MSEQRHEAPSIPEWDIADRMRKALRSSGVGVQEIADYLSVGRNTVSNWINGRIQPSVQSQRLWALRTGVSYQWLSTGESENRPSPQGGGGGDDDGLPGVDSNHQPAGYPGRVVGFPGSSRTLAAAA